MHFYEFIEYIRHTMGRAYLLAIHLIENTTALIPFLIHWISFRYLNNIIIIIIISLSILIFTRLLHFYSLSLLFIDREYSNVYRNRVPSFIFVYIICRQSNLRTSILFINFLLRDTKFEWIVNYTPKEKKGFLLLLFWINTHGLNIN
jgi:hypothetical protein